ncbi:radical SAM/SPASM domain-containing protein [Massilia scottii]|uniref:radical SAM/SPASM domain-containing protein n=1 Tax=Massilia scottii TaxID=3057166 RepID=UPI00279682FD|nr:radical SAM protein [Massilia sp. CCM 9029]MDQ1829790.1 SPASM domain-containing protein [Massilia sp. CCM 9029]
MMISASRYNFHVLHDNGAVLFNAFSGGLISLAGPDASELAELLMNAGMHIDVNGMPNELAKELFDKGFLTTSPLVQFDEIRARFKRARSDTPMVLTVTTTLDCNLGCFYCYQERSSAKLSPADIPQLVADARRRLVESGKRSLHVDWYGGEPLLNFAFMESASRALQEMCNELHVAYRASIISNGTLWPANVEEFILTHAIGQVQVSFDGMKSRHDKVRRFLHKETQRTTSSFDLAVALIDRLCAVVRVDVRLNLDKSNAGEVEDFLNMAIARGWFASAIPVVVQPARIADFSDHSNFLKSHKMSLGEFDELRTNIRSLAGDSIAVDESEVPDGYPYPRKTVCAALANDSYVVGADKRVFRCGLQVSEPSRAVGKMREAGADIGHIGEIRRIIPIVPSTTEVQAAQQKKWWEDFDPCNQPTCSTCSFLPICMGGCPKKHLEDYRDSLDEQGLYWRNNLPRLLLTAANVTPSQSSSIPLTSQFRSANVNICTVPS